MKTAGVTDPSLATSARVHWALGRPDAAVREACAAYRQRPDDSETAVLLASLLGEFPAQAGPELRGDLHRLIRDPQVAPDPVSIAGWLLVMREAWWNTATSEDACNALAAHLEADELALALLDEAPVFVAGAEIVLTRIRRSVLLNARWPIYPRLTQALAQQAQLNGGAWPFDEEERVRLGRDACHPFQHAYTPPAPNSLADTNGFVHPTTRAVAQGYERWPYPQWRRVMAPAAPDRLPELVRRLDPGGPDILPLRATILIAGCGTGSEAAQVARDFPDATITAIDLSEASLAYARRQCAALGLPSIRFQRLDLHDVGSLNERFDAIFCSGVLHHLPDPEAGWTKLAGVLRAGGVMRIMLYARAARQWVTQARDRIADLAGRPLDDDLIRQVRRRFLDDPQDPRSLPVLHASAFATLAGTHDLLLHPREDGFDVPRIARSLARLKLRLLTFHLPSPDAAARYDALFPRDPMHRDLQSWALFERREPMAFLSQYSFWCR